MAAVVYPSGKIWESQCILPFRCRSGTTCFTSGGGNYMGTFLIWSDMNWPSGNNEKSRKSGIRSFHRSHPKSPPPTGVHYQLQQLAPILRSFEKKKKPPCTMSADFIKHQKYPFCNDFFHSTHVKHSFVSEAEDEISFSFGSDTLSISLRSLWPSALVGSMISLTNCFCKKVKRGRVSVLEIW